MRSFAFIGLVAIAACTQTADSEDPVVIADRATVVDPELREMTQVLPDRIVVTTARDDIHRKLFGMIGQTFVGGRSGDSEGFVREVVSVERNGDATTLMTATSSLGNVLTQGHVRASQDWATAGDLAPATTGKVSSSGEFVIPETVLFDAGALGKLSHDGRSVVGNVKIDGGSFRFRPKIDIDAVYDHGLQEFHFDAKGDLDARIVMSAKVTVAGKATVGSTTSDSLETTVKLFESPKVRSGFFVGIVPVEFATSMFVEAKCSVQLDQSVEVSAGGTLSGSMATGLDWKKGRITTHGQKPSFHFDAFANAKSSQAVELECNVTLGVKILFYEVLGATLSIGPYAKARMERNSNKSGALLSIWTGAKAELEGKFEILDHELTLEPENPLFVWPDAQNTKPAKVYEIDL